MQTFNESLRLSIVFECIGLYAGLKYLLQKISLKRKTYGVIKRLASYCFGSYLVHLLFREVLEIYLGWNAESFFPAVWTPLLAFIIFCISMVTSAIVHRIPVLKKWVV